METFFTRYFGVLIFLGTVIGFSWVSGVRTGVNRVWVSEVGNNDLKLSRYSLLEEPDDTA